MLDEKARNAIREEGLSAWLFHNVFHRDDIADLVLGVSPERKNTRPWVCVLFPDRPPVKIVHAIEAGILQHLPGETIRYSARDEFREALRRALPAGGRVAADYSPNIPVGSFLDHGTALLLRSLGADLVPAEGLVARYLGGLDDAGRASHEAAGRVLYAAVADAWTRLCATIAEEKAVAEGDVSGWIGEVLARAGLVSDAPPVVGAGAHTADPHYGPEGAGAAIKAGDLVQFDVWARSPDPAGVYADISWVGVLARSASAEQEGMFAAVRDARDAAISLIQGRLAAAQRVSGADADRAARAVLEQRGLADLVRHRTGHSIGGRVHGYGVNLDSVEFPDERALSDGACFSVEPGVYGTGSGMRTEVDCIIHDGRLTVTGGERQAALLTLSGTHVRNR
jgi:Xaa-Pro aminopeptidase